MTEIHWPTPYGYTDFCDDIRQEIAGKITLVGLYAGEMKIFGTLPLNVSKLALAIHYFEKPGEGNDPLELRILLPGDADDAPTQRIEIPPRDHQPKPTKGGDDPRIGLHMMAVFSPLQVTQFGQIRVRMKKGDDIVRLGTLLVTEGTADDAARAGIVLPPPVADVVKAQKAPKRIRTPRRPT